MLIQNGSMCWLRRVVVDPGKGIALVIWLRGFFIQSFARKLEGRGELV